MSSRTRLCFPLSALTAAALLAATPRAHACTPLPEGVSGSIPAEAQKYPGNAAVILQGQGISLINAAVSVDGVPATLTDVSSTLFNGLGIFAVTVTPTPAAGQAVTIMGKFCDAGASCPPYTLHYVATAADTVAPPAIDLVNFDAHDYTDFKSGGGDCQSDSDFAWWITLKSQVPDLAKDGALMYRIEGYTDATPAGGAVVEAFGYIDDTGQVKLPIRRTVSVLNGKPLPEAMCFRVKSFDSAGNTPSISPELLCKPCNYRAEGVPGNGFPPPEPTWTAADIYAGGPCDSSMTGSGGNYPDGGLPHDTTSSTGGAGGSGGGANGDQVVDGCGCRIGGEDESSSGLFGALIVAMGASLRLARRRR
jgi:MYXO-CTERM domain-containing protein